MPARQNTTSRSFTPMYDATSRVVIFARLIVMSSLVENSFRKRSDCVFRSR
jgi:hypothetical protein